MYQILLYSSLFIAVVSFFLCCIALARVGKLIKSVEGLDWSAVATLTGDLAIMKKSIQTVNNRINGLSSPVVDQKNLMQNYMAQVQQPNPNDRLTGG